MPSFWNNAASTLVYNALVDRFAQQNEQQESEMVRYADYRDGRPNSILKYFKKRLRENETRFQDRPKLSWPLCRTIVDTHAEALSKGVKASVDAESSQRTAEEWDAIWEHNEMGPYLSNQVATVAGTYGGCFVRPILHRETDWKNKQSTRLEFDAFTPLECKLVTESGAGRSVRRFHGVAIQTAYNVENGEVFPWPLADKDMISRRMVQMRMEFITPTRWEVWIDGRLAPMSDFGDIWMPSEDGKNPYGFIPGALFNGLETEEFYPWGASDIRQSVYDVQMVNEIWSDIVYMHRMYAPLDVLKSDNRESKQEFSRGVGAGMGIGTQDDFQRVAGSVDWVGVMEPFRAALELTYSNAKVPSVAVGMGHLFKGNVDVSGKAKEYEWKPTVSHAVDKRVSFARGLRQLVRASLRMATIDQRTTVRGESVQLGLGVGGVVPDAPITVEFSPDIIPTSKEDELDRMQREIIANVTATVSAMAEYHGWTPERAAQEMDLIVAERNAERAQIPFKDVIQAVDERQRETPTAAEMNEARGVLFGAPPALAADMAATGDGQGAAAVGAQGSLLEGLNGAQIRAVLDVLANLSNGAIQEEQAKALVNAVGVPPDMVSKIVRRGRKAPVAGVANA